MKFNLCSITPSSLGHDNPVKHLGGCGNSVALDNLALVETSCTKTVHIFGDYSKQHLAIMNKEKSFTLHEQPEIDQPDQPESDGMLQNIVWKSLFRK